MIATGITTLLYTTLGCNQQYFSLRYKFLFIDTAIDATIMNGTPVKEKHWLLVYITIVCT